MSGPTPRHLLHFVTRRLRLRQYLRDPGDGRPQPQIPAQLLLWALLVGQTLRQYSFHALEALVRSPARRNLSLSKPFSDDALGYFTERLDPGPTRAALLSVIRRAKRNKAFEESYWIGLAIDGTGAGWRTRWGLFALPSAAQCPQTDPRLSTFFGADQRGGNWSVLAFGCGALRARR
jgi:hypothetical protein